MADLKIILQIFKKERSLPRTNPKTAYAGGGALNSDLLKPIDLFRLAPIGDPQISPDGSRILFVRDSSDAKTDSVRSEIWCVDVNTQKTRKLTAGDKRDTMPRWSPDGTQIAFVSNRTGKNQLHLISPDGGEAERIATREEPSSAPVWSNDGKNIAFVASIHMEPGCPFYPGAPERTDLPELDDEKLKESVPRVIKTLHHKQDRMGFFGNKFRHIFVVSAIDSSTEAKTIQLTSGRYNHDSPAWSPSDEHIACVANRELEDDDPVWIRHLWVIEVSTKSMSRVLVEEYPVVSPSWSPDGKKLAFIGADHPFDWVSSPYNLFCVDFAPERFPLTFADATCLTKHLDRWVGSQAGSDVSHSSQTGPVWLKDQDAILFLMASEGESHIYKAESGNISRLTTGERRSVGSFSVSDKALVAFMAGDATHPNEVFLRTPEGEETMMTRVNVEAAAGISFSEPERILFKAPDGWDIEGWVMKPYGYEPGKQYPTILSVHGGPSGMYGYGFTYQFQLYASNGYAVVYINPRGSSGYSREFSLGCVGDWGGKDFLDLMAGLDHVVDMGIADPDRLGITGWSYGGIMTCLAVAQTHRFKAGVAGALIADYLSTYGTSDVGAGFVSFSAGHKSWEAPVELVKQSAISRMANVTTPLLLIHGENDLRCPVGQAEEVFTALKTQAKDCVMVRYPGEPHGLGKPRNIIDRFERTLAWFDHYLR